MVIDVFDHPNADFIRLAIVDIGRDKVQIVFGGPALVKAGDFVPVALPGTRLPGRRKMRRTRFRGAVSHGMFCSSTELGWEENGPDEVAILRPTGLAPGTGLDNADWSALKADETEFHRTRRALWQQLRSTVQTPPVRQVPGGAGVHVEHVSGGGAALLGAGAGVDWLAVAHSGDGVRFDRCTS